jgi:curved DNA-binding protein
VARDYYDALGVSRRASEDEIHAAYRKLARRYHPDVSSEPDAEDKFKEVSEAYQVLSDPETRKRYDRFGEDFRRVPEDWEERVGAGSGGVSGGGRGGARVRYSEGFDGGIDFEDLFGGIFGGRGGFGPMFSADHEAELALTVEEVYRGGKRKIVPPGSGRGFQVTIPPGVIDGQRIRLAGQGGQGGGNGPPGDLYLVVRIKPHPRYRLDGRDILVDLPVSPWEAALGATIAITTPGGEAKVKVAPGASTGRRLRLRGEGMPRPHGTPGDLYAEIKVMVPPRPTKRERELFEQLAAESTFDPRREK